MHFSILASLGASGWYLYRGISSSIGYHEITEEFESWKPALAVVTSRNKTYPGIGSVGPFLPFFTDKPFYCAILEYETLEGETAVATSKTNCDELSSQVVLGEEMEIIYNPEDTQQVLEKDIVDDSLSALIGAIVIVFTFALGFLCCAIVLWRKRDTPIGLERHAHQRRVVPSDRDVELALEELDRRGVEEFERRKKERENEVLKHFHFETVSSDSGEESILSKAISEDGSHTTDPSTSTEDSLPHSECCICMEKYLEGDHICTPTTNACNHVFHKSCVVEWLQRHNHCPLCRVNLVQDGYDSFM